MDFKKCKVWQFSIKFQNNEYNRAISAFVYCSTIHVKIHLSSEELDIVSSCSLLSKAWFLPNFIILTVWEKGSNAAVVYTVMLFRFCLNCNNIDLLASVVSNTISLMLVNSLLMSLYHPSFHKHWFSMTVSKVISVLCLHWPHMQFLSRYMQKDVNDKLFFGHTRFSVQNFITST